MQQIHARQNHAFFFFWGGGGFLLCGHFASWPFSFFFLGLHSPGSEGLKGNLAGETAVWQATMDMTTLGQLWTYCMGFAEKHLIQLFRHGTDQALQGAKLRIGWTG